MLAIVGPTASGKSALAHAVARQLIAGGRNVEIVAIDAFTVYRGMDVGTAKPTAEERAEIPHHLVDVLDPWQEVSVAEFQGWARTAIDEVFGRGGTPLLVGGAGLYWRAVVDPLRFPPTDARVRAELEHRWADDPAAGHAHLAALDPDAAARIDAGNLRRTVRALEVIALTGERFSTFDDAWSRTDSIYPGLEVAYLEPDPTTLRHAIDRRAAAMVAGGLLDEARTLRGLPEELSRTAQQAIGYAEAFAVLDGRLSEQELVPAIAVRTWRYARRQRAWFRTDRRCQPVAPDDVLARWR